MTCPHCGGAHLEGLRFQHRSVCDLYGSETQTQQADVERIRANHRRPITRPATPAETTLLEALGYPTDGDVQIHVAFGGGLWRRTPTTKESI